MYAGQSPTAREPRKQAYEESLYEIQGDRRVLKSADVINEEKDILERKFFNEEGRVIRRWYFGEEPRTYFIEGVLEATKVRSYKGHLNEEPKERKGIEFQDYLDEQGKLRFRQTFGGIPETRFFVDTETGREEITYRGTRENTDDPNKMKRRDVFDKAIVLR